MADRSSAYGAWLRSRRLNIDEELHSGSDELNVSISAIFSVDVFHHDVSPAARPEREVDKRDPDGGIGVAVDNPGDVVLRSCLGHDSV